VGRGDVNGVSAAWEPTGLDGMADAAVEGRMDMFLSLGARTRRSLDSSRLGRASGAGVAESVDGCSGSWVLRTIFCIMTLRPRLLLRLVLSSLNSAGGTSCDIRLQRLGVSLGELLLRRWRWGVSWMLPSRSGTTGIGGIGIVSTGGASSDVFVSGGLGSWMSVAPLERAEKRSGRSMEMTRCRVRWDPRRS